MNTKCESKPITKKQIITQSIGTIVGILFASYLESIGHPIIGWFLGGIILGIGVLFAYHEPGKRWTFFNITGIILSAVILSTVYYYAKLLT